uniref:NADH-ubiquinone oxidoreductase chain 5 n=1 Tax=Amphiura sp. JN-2020 TaxID=2763518 RepID=A0A7H0R1L7_9ECHI|nr:NADH dehydrogenase subunit 5 [Amphiura sp. JN-2020]
MILWNALLISLVVYLLIIFFSPNTNQSKITISLLSSATLISISINTYWIILGLPNHTININWITNSLQEINLAFSLDFVFIIFASTALFVTWSIVEFSHYYMKGDPNKATFFNILLLFLLFMLLLTSSNSLFTLFIGWEGVGILSFILISWWYSRSEANSAALQAIIYNRIGDSGIILFILLIMSSLNTWNLNETILINSFSPIPTWCLIGIVIAAMGKSAQFSLHPWLPSAMEGPTPVSALLHSSTMVVAGVFLLIRTYPLLNNSIAIQQSITLIGALTAIFAGSVALGQYDIKKIIAYSTTSQLGLMVFCVGVGLPWLALYHICTHAFFKALLFLCSGSIIHSTNNEQDLRKMGNSGWNLPLTSGALAIGSLSLCGFPFLAGFYSKDLILEAAQISTTNSISIILVLIATLTTALYSIRLIMFLFLSNNNGNEIVPLGEAAPNQGGPLLRLLLGVFLAGWAFGACLFPPTPLLIPLGVKSLPLIVTIIPIFLVFLNSYIPLTWSSRHINLSSFLASNWLYAPLFHSLTALQTIQGSGQGVLRTLDQGWTALLGPIGGPLIISISTRTVRSAQSGKISHYLIYSLILGAILLVLSNT